MRALDPFMFVRAGALALATLSLLSCAEAPDEASRTQNTINAPLPSGLDPILHAKTTVTVGPFTQVFGDISSTGQNGSVLFDVSASQGFGANTLASKITVRTGAQAGHLFGNDLTVDGGAAAQTLGLDPGALPAVPDVTAAVPGATSITVNASQARQLCPGSYGAISLGTNAILNLNGGVYQISRLTLAAGARLEPSEPVVVLVAGNLTTTGSATIAPSAQALGALAAADIRIEVAGAVTLADGSRVTAHLLVPNGKVTIGKNATLTGAAWAKSIAIGAQSLVIGDGKLAAVATAVPPPCNDNSACTVDACVGGGTAAGFCRNTPVAVGTSCEDGNTCNGDELCNAAGQCQPGTNTGAGTSCPDGDLCNGDETCNGGGTCVPSTPPVVSDDNSCTVDACDATTGVAHIPLPDGSTCNGTGTCTAGVCSAVARNLVMINDVTGHLERLDPDTLEVTDIGPLGVPYAFGDCMFNPADGKLYMVDGRGDSSLYTVDLATGRASLIGFHGNSAMEGLAFHPPSNQIFGTSLDDVSLFTLSATTGAASLVRRFGVGFQGLAWDSLRNVMTAFNGSQIFAVDVTNGGLTQLASTPFVRDFGMTYDPVIDRFWVVDFDGRVLQLDPGQGFGTTLEAFIGGSHTCIASVPVPVGP
ncbi:MAG: hypothetical protein H7138_12325 [Myxococcales bacterium]|nr:hypothetical protein [Myxococcales bacterium]